MILQCTLSRPVTFVDWIYFLISGDGTLETLTSIPNFENPGNSEFSNISGTSEAVSDFVPTQAWNVSETR